MRDYSGEGDTVVGPRPIAKGRDEKACWNLEACSKGRGPMR